jgi:(2Fe-2S) ferredoxin
MNFNYDRDPEFDLEGRFLGFVLDGSEIKYVRVAVAEEELQIKLPKPLRTTLFNATLQGQLNLQPWDYLQISGQTKFNPKTGGFKLKAYQISKKDLPDEDESTIPEAVFQTNVPQPTPSKSPKRKREKIRLMVCHKSGCLKKGGKRQQQAIENLLRDRGLHESVILQETGCLGKCSMAPNIVLMPGKKRLSGMRPEAIADLLETDHLH